jgi:hypothetical protein
MKFKSLIFAPQGGAPERCTKATSASKKSIARRPSRIGFALYLCAGIALATAFLNPARAQAPAPACAGIPDDAKRLACYDQQYGSPHAPSKSASPDPADQSSAARESKKDFSFSAAVTLIEHRGARFVVTLDNEQMWAQIELNSRIDVRVGDMVRIRRGALGSYLLSNDAGIATRVRRVR